MRSTSLQEKGLRLDDRLALNSAVIEQLHPHAAREFLAAAEVAGVGSLWFGEVLGREAFSSAALALSATQEMTVVNAVARALERPPKSVAGAQRLLWDDHPGRYLLGLGASGATRERGQSPVAFMTDYLRDLDAEHERQHPGSAPLPRVLGAYSSGLTRVAERQADGIVTFLVPPQHTTWAREQLGPVPFLGVTQWVLFDDDPSRARAAVRQRLAYYLTLPHQLAKFRRLGIPDADLVAPGSDALVDMLCAWGSVEQVAERLEAHVSAGADRVLIGHLDPPDERLLEHLARLGSRVTVGARAAATPGQP